MYARAKLDAADNTDLVPYFNAPVQQLDVNSHCLIKEWESARQACKSLGMSLKPFARNLADFQGLTQMTAEAALALAAARADTAVESTTMTTSRPPSQTSRTVHTAMEAAAPTTRCFSTVSEPICCDIRLLSSP